MASRDVRDEERDLAFRDRRPSLDNVSLQNLIREQQYSLSSFSDAESSRRKSGSSTNDIPRMCDRNKPQNSSTIDLSLLRPTLSTTDLPRASDQAPLSYNTDDLSSLSTRAVVVSAVTSNSNNENNEGSPEDPSPQSTTALNDLQPVTKARQLTVLLSAFLTICITIGFNQSYGVFQSAYTSPTDTILTANTSVDIQNGALIAFVGTFGAGLTWAGSIVVNPLMARARSLRHVTTAGVVLMSVGFGLASLATRTWHLLLTQGFLFGIGSSMLYFPVTAVCPEYFAARRGTAMGVVMSGAGVGGVMLSPVVRTLISNPHIGVRWTLRLLALVVLVVGLPIAVTAPPSRFTRQRATHVDLKLALKPAFMLSVMAALLQSSGNFIPLTFLSEFSMSLGYTASFGAALIAVNNGINSLSRVATGFAGDRFGRQNVTIVTILASAVSVCGLWLGSASSGSKSLWLSFVVFYGVLAGGYNALFPTVISEVFGIQAYASVNGFICFVRGIGAFFGSPVGGAILGAENVRKNYLNVVYFDSALLFGAGLCVVGVRYFDAREKGRWLSKA